MRLTRAVFLLMVAGIWGQAAAQSIFNVSPTQPRGAQHPVQTPTPAGSMPLQASASQQASSSLVDPKVMAQFDQLPNESNDAYLTRLKALSQRAVADMERVSREHTAKMKALAPK